MGTLFGASRDDRQGPARGAASRRDPLLVGWLLDGQHPGFVYQGPRPVGGAGGRELAAEALPYYPDVGAEESRYFEVPCPFDLRLRPGTDREGRRGLVNTAERGRTVNPRQLSTFAVLMEPDLWRDPQRPIVQIVTPYRFLTDETCWMSQVPAFDHYRAEPWPGVFIGGRLPIHLWPRLMSWAFEWHDSNQELVLNAGEPWYYLKFESEDPTRPVRVVEAEMTAELRQYCTGLDGLIHFANRTFSYFEVARQRRPARLLKPLER